MNYNIILWGLGAMASGMARIIQSKEGLEITGAIAKRTEKNGLDLGEALALETELAVRVNNDARAVLSGAGKGVVLHTTGSFLRDTFSELELAMKCGHDVVSIAEEMAYPLAQEPQMAAELDRIARENGVTILGTGINPGFILDTLIIALTGVCADVKRIKGVRVNDLSCFGPTVMRTQGVGTSIENFQTGDREGSIVGHIGFAESIRMIADTVGWTLDEVVQTREPIITNVPRETPYIRVAPGMVAGCKHIAYGMKDGEAVITLEHPQQIRPEAEGTKTGDFIEIIGEPDIYLNISPEVPGGLGTMAVAVNMIPKVLAAPSGLLTMRDLPVPSAILGNVHALVNQLHFGPPGPGQSSSRSCASGVGGAA